ncbi:hypothetical protein DFH09DRAFT_1086893 [Mycena vulgaris]|nr:hypothetical protein DFH09DRAFT_1086893 [Mycena vulgaris]
MGAPISGTAAEIFKNMAPVSVISSSRTLMSTSYLLLVQTVDGIVWKPGPKHGKTPNLYVAVYQDGVELQRTPIIKRALAPKWGHVMNMWPDRSILDLSEGFSRFISSFHGG